MKIFVGYGYNDRDRWVERLVFPLIKAFGDEVVDGKELFGQQISEAVRSKIDDSDALIGFTTRRDQGPDGTWTTHQWVHDELVHALGRRIPRVEVREVGVQGQDGMLGGLQRIPYAEAERDLLLVELARAISKWHERGRIRMQLSPQELVAELWPLLRSPDLRCTYRFLVGDEESPPLPAVIRKINQGLFLVAKDVPREALIQVQVEHRSIFWTSAYQTTDSLDVKLERM
jgi:hypothetical protein